MTDAKTHCQICGRLIKSKRGRIALHGYTRPSQGWQTASCPGARNLPYEVSCNRIADTIGDCERWIETTRAAIERDTVEPPPTLQVKVRGYYGRGYHPVEPVARPEGFDPAKLNSYPRLPRSYVDAYDTMQSNRRQGIQATQQTIVALRERLAAWSPVPAMVAYWRDILGYRV